MLAVPEELAPILQELYLLYSKGNCDAVKEGLLALVDNLKLGLNSTHANHQLLQTSDLDSDLDMDADSSKDGGKDNFLKSWHDILDLRVYVDTEIYGTLDSSAPIAIATPGKVVKHQEAADAYARAWIEIGEKLANLPDDAFSRQWGTVELAEFLHCSPNRLRQAKKKNRLPLQVDNFLIDCVSGNKSKKLIWRIQPL